MNPMTEESDPKMKALAKVKAASEAHLEARAAELRAREAHQAAIVEALQIGVGPSALEGVSSYDRQHINRIRNSAGLPPKRRPTVQRIPRDENK